MDDKNNSSLNEKLDIIIKLLSIQVIGDGNNMDAVSKLTSAGISSTQIGKIIGRQTNYITACISRLRKSNGKQKSKTKSNINP
jgi:hypothetical protein